MRILLSFILPIIFAAFLVTLTVNSLQFWQQHRFTPPLGTFQAGVSGGEISSR